MYAIVLDTNIMVSGSVALRGNDMDDNKFLEVAVEGDADYIVSGDKHLKRLGNFMEIEIISPAEMAAILRTQSK